MVSNSYVRIIRRMQTLARQVIPKNVASTLSMDLRRDRKRSLNKLMEMQEAQEYAQTPDSEERRQRN